MSEKRESFLDTEFRDTIEDIEGIGGVYSAKIIHSIKENEEDITTWEDFSEFKITCDIVPPNKVMKVQAEVNEVLRDRGYEPAVDFTPF